MDQRFEQFVTPFLAYDKATCFELVEEWVNVDYFDVLDFYDNVLIPAMQSIPCDANTGYQIWQEHALSAIIRTIIERLYPFVLEQRNIFYGKEYTGVVAIFAPHGDTHEIGAKLVADYFNLLGFNTHYIGLDTPKTVIPEMVKQLHVGVLGISVTNTFSLVELQKTIEYVRSEGIDIPIVVGGMAFTHEHHELDLGERVYIAQSYQMLKELVEREDF